MSDVSEFADNAVGEFVERLHHAAGSNLLSVILYGSAVSGEFAAEFSDVNLICILRDTSLPALAAIAATVAWWQKQKHSEPLILGNSELQGLAKVFAIEFADLRRDRRVLFGDDPISSLPVPAGIHRAQLRYELSEKLLLFRQRLIQTVGDRKRTWDLLHDSLPAFATLFRHVLMEKGGTIPKTRRDSIEALAGSAGFDPSPFLEVLNVREKKMRGTNDLNALSARYLETIERVIAYLEQLPEARDGNDGGNA